MSSVGDTEHICSDESVFFSFFSQHHPKAEQVLWCAGTQSTHTQSYSLIAEAFSPSCVKRKKNKSNCFYCKSQNGTTVNTCCLLQGDHRKR